jgi:GT2 family glycosyltransferase
MHSAPEEQAGRHLPRIGVVLTCHNRRDTTLGCLDALERQVVAAQVDTYLVDDGSTDGTAAAVHAAHPDVRIIQGDGELYWSPGMKLALEHASKGDYDFYLWLNDDSTLDPGALQTLLSTHDRLEARGETPAIVVGSTRDPEYGYVTYGGQVRPDPRRPLQFTIVQPGDEPVRCETMNGNVVLVPRAVVQRIGHIDAAYRHSMGDQDYGLRATAAGIGVWAAPGTLAICAPNPTPVFGRGPLLAELRSLAERRRGLPPQSWATFSRRWAGPAWPLYFASPYLRRAAQVVASHVR